MKSPVLVDRLCGWSIYCDSNRLVARNPETHESMSIHYETYNYFKQRAYLRSLILKIEKKEN